MSLIVSEISSPEENIAWDTFVAQHPEGTFAQLSGWANLKQQFEWQSHILVVRDGSKVVAGALMMDRVGLLGKKVSYIPYGPLIATKNEQALRLLMSELDRESRLSVVLRLEPHLSSRAAIDELAGILKEFSFERSDRFLQPEATLLLDLNQSEDELQAGMRQTTRRYIRQAERAELEVVEDVVGDRMADFYAILQQVDQRRQFGVHTLEYYAKAWEALGAGSREVEDKRLIQPYLFLVQKDGEVLGAYFLVRAGNKSWELYGGVNEAGMRLKANYLLKWHSILTMKRDGVVVYDQWGVAPLAHGQESEYDKNHRLAGVTYFKEGFGGKRVSYAGSYDKVNQPLFYKLARFLRKL